MFEYQNGQNSCSEKVDLLFHKMFRFPPKFFSKYAVTREMQFDSLFVERILSELRTVATSKNGEG